MRYWGIGLLIRIGRSTQYICNKLSCERASLPPEQKVQGEVVPKEEKGGDG